MYVHIFVKERKEGRYPPIETSILFLNKQHGLIYLHLIQLKWWMPSELQLNPEPKRSAPRGGKLQSFTLLLFVITSGFPGNLFLLFAIVTKCFVFNLQERFALNIALILYRRLHFQLQYEFPLLFYILVANEEHGDTLCFSCLATQQESCHCPFVFVWLGGEWRDEWVASRQLLKGRNLQHKQGKIGLKSGNKDTKDREGSASQRTASLNVWTGGMMVK